ncbi:MAG: hypothetical protein JWP35_138 [Caulobacter sp.]|nr:hypothetical protein [Caulobacter sp.]
MMNEDTHHQLLDLIYDAAIAPGRWVQAMEGMTDALGGNSAWLSQLSVADGSGAGLIARIDPVMPERYIGYYAPLNPFSVHANPHDHVARWSHRITTDTDWFDKDTLHRTEFYNDFMRPQRVDNVMMVSLALEGFQSMDINLNRPASAGQFGAEERRFVAALHPHLIRAFRLSRVFSDLTATVDATASALDHSAQALFILDPSGKIQRTNRLADRMLARRGGLCRVGGKLTAVMPEAARGLQALIGAAGSPDAATRTGGSLALTSPRSFTPVSITVAPIQADRWPVPGGAPSVLVCATDPRTELDIPDQTMRGLFALTPAEIRVVRALLDGSSPRQAAISFGVALTTVRSQMASIFEKTGAAGQADLSRLMTRIASGPAN